MSAHRRSSWLLFALGLLAACDQKPPLAPEPAPDRASVAPAPESLEKKDEAPAIPVDVQAFAKSAGDFLAEARHIVRLLDLGQLEKVSDVLALTDLLAKMDAPEHCDKCRKFYISCKEFWQVMSGELILLNMKSQAVAAGADVADLKHDGVGVLKGRITDLEIDLKEIATGKRPRTLKDQIGESVHSQ